MFLTFFTHSTSVDTIATYLSGAAVLHHSRELITFIGWPLQGSS
jgi:hypothetical protein